MAAKFNILCGANTVKPVAALQPLNLGIFTWVASGIVSFRPLADPADFGRVVSCSKPLHDDASATSKPKRENDQTQNRVLAPELIRKGLERRNR